MANFTLHWQIMFTQVSQSKSNHPMAAALVDYGRWHSIESKPKDVEEFQNFTGEGIQGKIEEMVHCFIAIIAMKIFMNKRYHFDIHIKLR